MFLYTMLSGALICLTGLIYYSWWLRVPENIRIYSGSRQELSFDVPASGELCLEAGEFTEVQASGFAGAQAEERKESVRHVAFDKPVTLIAGSRLDSYTLRLKLLGFIPFKNVNIQVVDGATVIPAGIPIGIYVRTRGVLVIGTGEFTGVDGQVYAPSKNLLKAGDYILKVNGNPVESKKGFMGMIQETGEKEAVLSIKRDEEVFDLKIKPRLAGSDEYKLGIWIRENAQGVGTLTYVSPDGSFGALGHGINDVDTSTLMDVKSGSLYETEIVGIRKGTGGAPGELTGIIDYNPKNRMGEIQSNTPEGIFGTCGGQILSKLTEDPVTIGLKQEVKTGPAQIICSITGQPKHYAVEITEIHLENDNINRGIVLKITDPELLSLTGGIVQGMSGSPILQDGKIIGAVTHVLVQDATKGYGIFIENMILTR